LFGYFQIIMNKFSKIIFLIFLFLLFGKTNFVFGVDDQKFTKFFKEAAREFLGSKEIKIGDELTKKKETILARTDTAENTQKLELEYPQISGSKPKGVKTGLEFFKYIYLFVIWSLGFLLFIVLLYYGILWYTAGTNIEQAVKARQRIIQAFLGAILLLGSWVLFKILGPQFTQIQQKISTPQRVKTLPEVVKKEGGKIINVYEIPVGKKINDSELISKRSVSKELSKYRVFGVGDSLVQPSSGEEEGFLRDGVPNSDASYNWGQSLIYDQEREQIKNDTENFAKITTDENKRRQYKTTIREVKEKVSLVYNKYCNCTSSLGYNCFHGCNECNKLKDLKNEVDNFPTNAEYDPITNDLEYKRNGVNEVEKEEIIEKGNYSHYKDEDYTERGKNAVKKISDLNMRIDCGSLAVCVCPNNSYWYWCFDIATQARRDCEAMKSTIEDFAPGWEIRKTGWQIIKETRGITQRQFQYLNLIQQSEKIFGSDYLYEGTVAKTKIDRILDINSLLLMKIDFAKNLALNTEALSAAITSLLTGGCHCFECIGCSGPCGGEDPCMVVRPLLSALQVALGVNIVAMPLVAQEVQKEIDKEIREKDELKKSLEELTEGIALSEKVIFSCNGMTKNGQFKQLFNSLEFLNYKNEVEKRGYKVVIQKLWPEIDPEGDPFTFYCVTGPLIEGISDTQDPNNLKNLKLYCDQSTESEVGELFDKIKYVIKGKEQILDQKDKEIKNAQRLVNEMRRNQQGLEQGLDNVKGDLSENELTAIGDKLKNISGQQFVQMIGNLPEKYAKEAIGNILENVSGNDAKNFFVKAFEGTGDFKGIFNQYLSSMGDDGVKKFSHAFLEATPDENLKNILISGFDSFSGDKLKEFWKNSFKNFTEDEKRIFFSKYLRDANEGKLEILFNYFVNNSSEVQKKQTLKEMLEVSDQSTIKTVLEKYLKISSTPVKNGNSNEFVEIQATLNLDQVISEIPSEELDGVLGKTKEILKEKNLLRIGMRNISSENIESAILKMPESEIKEFTHHFYEGLDESEVKDFVLENVLDADPAFFQKFTKELSEENLKDLIVEQGFKALPESQAKEVFLLMHELPNMDPRKVLNPLFLKYIPTNKLSGAMGILQHNFGILDQFLGEAAAVFNFSGLGNISGMIRDVVDKISSFTVNIQNIVNQILDVVQLPLDQLVKYVQDVWNQLPNLAVGELLNEIIRNIPYQDLLSSIKEILKTLPLDALKNIAKEIFDQLPLDELKKFFQEIIDSLPISEIKIALREIIKVLPLEELRINLKNLSLSLENRVTIFKECIYPYLSEEEQKNWLGGIHSEEDWNYFLDNVQSKQVIYCATDRIPEDKLRGMLKEKILLLSKADLVAILLKLPSINLYLEKLLDKLPLDFLQKLLRAFPEKELKNFFNALAKNLPLQILRQALNQALALFQNTVNQLLSQLLNNLPLEMLNNLVNQLLSAIPIKQLVETFNQIISQLSTQILGPILGQLQNLLGSLFSLFSGGPGLKQNAIEMMKYPNLYSSAGGVCCYAPCHGVFCPCPCVGTPGPVPLDCSAKPVLKRMALITINVGKIVAFKSLVDNALNTEKDLIENKIKKDIWPSVAQDTYIFSSQQCITIEPGKEGYLVKCEDALRYGWVGKCDHKYNFVCCKRK